MDIRKVREIVIRFLTFLMVMTGLGGCRPDMVICATAGQICSEEEGERNDGEAVGEVVFDLENGDGLDEEESDAH